MTYHLVTTLFMVAALALYVVGSAFGGSLVLAVALAIEVWFWIRIVRGKPRLNTANDRH